MQFQREVDGALHEIFIGQTGLAVDNACWGRSVGNAPNIPAHLFRARHMLAHGGAMGVAANSENLVNVFQCHEHRCAAVAPLHD